MNELPTRFAQAARAEPETVLEQMKTLASEIRNASLLDSVSDILAILNEHRQVVFSNRRLSDLLGTDLETLVGQRPGELLGCLQAKSSRGGCTTAACQDCGAVQAILDAEAGKESVKECRIQTTSGAAHDLRVRATPLDLNGCTYVVFAATDIGHEKRRQALERVFFHDVMNMAGNILGATCLLQGIETSGEQKQLLEVLRNSSEQLMEEVKSQRSLLSAEQGDLAVDADPLESLKVLTSVGLQYAASELARDRDIRLGTPAEAVGFVSDRALVSRVLGNVLKNGLEATSPGGTVTLCCWEEQGAVVFSVHSPVAMSSSVQRQVFQRSFSTKGRGRGIGAYSTKLLAEKYLGGSVWFESSEATGTRFFLRIPLRTD